MTTSFDYLRPVIHKYVHDDLQIECRQHDIVESLDEQAIAELAYAHDEIVRRGHIEALSKAIGTGARAGGRGLFLLLVLFRLLGQQKVEPFCSGAVRLLDVSPPFDWSNLPTELSYLAQPSEEFGKYQFDPEISAFLKSANREDIAMLRSLKTKTDADCEAISAFVYRYDMVTNKESRYVYYLLNLLDAL